MGSAPGEGDKMRSPPDGPSIKEERERVYLYGPLVVKVVVMGIKARSDQTQVLLGPSRDAKRKITAVMFMTIKCS